MFAHILFPVDGEAPSSAAIVPCVTFARDAGARLLVLHVTEPFHVISTDPDMLVDTPARYRVQTKARARKLLETVAAEALAQKVVYETLVVEHPHPYRVIIDTARQRGCDLIGMAAHGRTGVQAVLLGSVTQKVLAHCHLPVLVMR